MLGFFAKIPHLQHGAVFLLCGIDPGLSDNYFSHYAYAMANEINRLSKPGDGVIIRDAFTGRLQRGLEESGQWEYMTDERGIWYLS